MILEGKSVLSHSQPSGRNAAGTSPYVLLIALTLFYMSSFVDRAIINILFEPIKRDLALTDTQLGLLGGLAFATLYSVLGIPVARLAERKNRLFIITVALTIWSAMTMLCGVAGTFWQLAAARAGVGIGEAACTPCAHSMIGDSFPPERRATALSIYSLGIPLGLLAGMLGGAWIAEAYSWRTAFFAVGAPGVFLALIAGFALREPQRGRFDPPVDNEAPSLGDVLRHLWSRPAFRHLLAGISLSTMIAAGHQSFAAPFLLRGDFNVQLPYVGLVLALIFGGATFAGTLAGGPLADKLARRDPKMMLRVPGIAYFMAGPLFALAFASTGMPLFIAAAFLGQIAGAIYLGPSFGSLHNMVEPRMRATAVAIVLMFASLVGYGLGPVLVGSLSDIFAAAFFGVDPANCPASASSACSEGIFQGLRYALVATSVLYLWPGYHYLRAATTLSEALLSNAPRAEENRPGASPATT